MIVSPALPITSISAIHAASGWEPAFAADPTNRGKLRSDLHLPDNPKVCASPYQQAAGNSSRPVYSIPPALNSQLATLLEIEPLFTKADRTLHLATLAIDGILSSGPLPKNCGVSLGTARGATGLFERRFNEFQEIQNRRGTLEDELREGSVSQSKVGRLSASTSPLTTAGALSSSLARRAGAQGFNLSHSMTCSSALQALTNSVAWIQSGLCEAAIVGGSEAPLTDFTIAQMSALGIYSTDTGKFPCRPLDDNSKGSSFVLGEGACCILVERADAVHTRPAQAYLQGVGFTQQLDTGLTGITHEGFADAMTQACEALPDGRRVDLVIMHAPGTVKGDAAELRALYEVFQNQPGGLPQLVSTKAYTGHTLGASGAVSIDLALECFAREKFPVMPYPVDWPGATDLSAPSTILVNAAGFGGNVSSVLLMAP